MIHSVQTTAACWRRLPLFECRYKSNGRIYICRIRAACVNDAAERLWQLDWAPGCGPVETPFRIFEGALFGLGNYHDAWVGRLGLSFILNRKQERGVFASSSLQ